MRRKAKPLEGEVEAPSTRGLWGDIFGSLGGIGPMLKMLSDPGLHLACHQMINSMIEGQLASRRVEAKLDLILKGLGHDVEAINASLAERFHAPILDGARALGDRAAPPAGASPDAGDRAASQAYAALGLDVSIDPHVAANGRG